MTLQTCFEAIYATNPLPCQKITVFGSSLILWSLWGSKSPIGLRHPLRHPVATIPGPWPCDPAFPQWAPAPLHWRIVQPDKPKTVGKKTQMFINLRPHIWLNISMHHCGNGNGWWEVPGASTGQNWNGPRYFAADFENREPKSSINGPFPMAMLNRQRLHTLASFGGI